MHEFIIYICANSSSMFVSGAAGVGSLQAGHLLPPQDFWKQRINTYEYF
jgi:hypothetical protein